MAQVFAEGLVGGVLLYNKGRHVKFWLTAAQARCAASFMLDPGKTGSECVTFSAWHKSSVEIATCNNNFTVLFNLADDVEGELVTASELELLGRQILDELQEEKPRA